jgi:hypothetical protein
VSTSGNISKIYGHEVIFALKGAFQLAVDSDLAVMFTYRKTFPSARLLDRFYLGRDIARLMNLLIVDYRATNLVQPFFRFKVVMNDELWARTQEDGS